MEGGPLFTYIRKFHSRRVYKNFGLSLNEFLELPPYVADLLLEICEAEVIRAEATHREVAKQMNFDFEDEL